jgi:hypothetical protein
VNSNLALIPSGKHNSKERMVLFITTVPLYRRTPNYNRKEIK